MELLQLLYLYWRLAYRKINDTTGDRLEQGLLIVINTIQKRMHSPDCVHQSYKEIICLMTVE
jgi:hypothetical protein